MNVAWALLWKDLLAEWRSRDRLIAMLVFAFLVIVVFQFAWPATAPRAMTPFAPAILWVTYLFTAMIGLGRTFTLELENDALTGLALAPGTRGWILIGKAAATWVLIGIVQALAALVFALFFRVDLLTGAVGLVAVAGLTNVGICSIGTLLSAMSVRSRFREVLLPVLLIPTLVPLLAAAVRGTSAALEGRGLPFDALQPLIVIGGVYAIVSFLLFDFVLEE